MPRREVEGRKQKPTTVERPSQQIFLVFCVFCGVCVWSVRSAWTDWRNNEQPEADDANIWYDLILAGKYSNNNNNYYTRFTRIINPFFTTHPCVKYCALSFDGAQGHAMMVTNVPVIPHNGRRRNVVVVEWMLMLMLMVETILLLFLVKITQIHGLLLLREVHAEMVATTTRRNEIDLSNGILYGSRWRWRGCIVYGIYRIIGSRIWPFTRGIYTKKKKKNHSHRKDGPTWNSSCTSQPISPTAIKNFYHVGRMSWNGCISLKMPI